MAAAVAGVAAEQHKYAAVVPVVQRHAEHRQKADAHAGEPPALALPQRRKPGAAQQHRRADGEVGRTQTATANSNAAPNAGCKSVARSPPRAADQHDDPRQEKHGRGRIAVTVRRVLDVKIERRAEQRADRHAMKISAMASAAVRSEISPEQAKHQKRQQQQQRNICRNRSRRRSDAPPCADSASPG